MKPDKTKQREEAISEAKQDLQKDIPQLLADIHDESVNTSDQQEANAAAICRTTARFASLLSVLSIKASDQHKENMAMQDKLVQLTWAIWILTAVLAVIAIIQIFHH